ncbi:hypothetical protein B0J14DRAFT_204407 [Halenospora varia]|nr:hypothetical protein B0J14DRAFT_204407 [Halenospora varia]
MTLDPFYLFMSPIGMIDYVRRVRSQARGEWHEHKAFISDICRLLCNLLTDRQLLSHTRPEDNWSNIDEDLQNAKEVLDRAKNYIRWQEEEPKGSHPDPQQGSLVAFLINHEAVASNKQNLMWHRVKLETIHFEFVREKEKERRWEEYVQKTKEDFSKSLADLFLR